MMKNLLGECIRNEGPDPAVNLTVGLDESVRIERVVENCDRCFN